MAELIKIDRNGSKHWRDKVRCDRCGGTGYYAVGIKNGQLILSPYDAGVCWKCGGKGWVIDTYIERTPEYQAKLDAKREAKRAEEQAKIDAEVAEQKARLKALEDQQEAERKAEEAREESRKAISQYVNEIGGKIDMLLEYIGSPHFERRSFGGYGTETCYIHTFLDDNGNKIIWKTGSGIQAEKGQKVKVRGTVKEHSEYNGEKQTILTRARISIAQ